MRTSNKLVRVKTSNKLLLIFFISSLAFFVVLNLALKEKYNEGDIRDLPDPGGEMVNYVMAKPPSWLSVTGNLNVRIMPSDSFSLKWEQGERVHLNFRESGDSLTITEDMPSPRDPHGPRLSYDYLPWVIIYCGHLHQMQLSGVLALLRGTKNRGEFRIGLDINNTQLCLGDNPNDGKIHPLQFYDSVRVHAVNSSLQLFKNTAARKLDMQLDDRSEIHDLGAQLDSPRLQYADSAQIHLSGRTLRKIELNIHPGIHSSE